MNIQTIIQQENLVSAPTPLMKPVAMHYCPGCSHGVLNRIIAEVIEEMDIQDNVIGVGPVGCGTFIYNYIDIDWQSAAHGRAPAMATGIKRSCPDKHVIVYQGDGDLAAIGTSEIIHAAARGENIVVLLVNNAIYGMTGGQMSPTTLAEQPTSTTPSGRSAFNGLPFDVSKMMADMPGTGYVTRQAVDTPVRVKKCRRALKKAIQHAEQRKGLSFIEVVSTCSEGWHMTPVESNAWMSAHMITEDAPLGDIKEV